LPGSSQQWLDVSTRDNGFAAGSFDSEGPFNGSQTSFVWDGLSDALEGNLVYNLGCQIEPCDAPMRAVIGLDENNNENSGATAARIVFRGNSLAGVASDVLMQDQNVLISTYYSTVMADSTNNFTTLLSTNAPGTQLLVTIPSPITNNYPTRIVDFYVVDPVALCGRSPHSRRYNNTPRE